MTSPSEFAKLLFNRNYNEYVTLITARDAERDARIEAAVKPMTCGHPAILYNNRAEDCEWCLSIAKAEKLIRAFNGKGQIEGRITDELLRALGRKVEP